MSTTTGSNVNITNPPSSTCPHCGHCPTCGRSNWPQGWIPSIPQWPTYPYPAIPWWGEITCTSPTTVAGTHC